MTHSNNARPRRMVRQFDRSKVALLLSGAVRSDGKSDLDKAQDLVIAKIKQVLLGRLRFPLSQVSYLALFEEEGGAVSARVEAETVKKHEAVRDGVKTVSQKREILAWVWSILDAPAPKAPAPAPTLTPAPAPKPLPKGDCESCGQRMAVVLTRKVTLANEKVQLRLCGVCAAEAAKDRQSFLDSTPLPTTCGCAKAPAEFLVEVMDSKGESNFAKMCPACHERAKGKPDTFIDSAPMK